MRRLWERRTYRADAFRTTGSLSEVLAIAPLGRAACRHGWSLLEAPLAHPLCRHPLLALDHRRPTMQRAGARVRAAIAEEHAVALDRRELELDIGEDRAAALARRF